jgi:hypothetical protein
VYSAKSGGDPFAATADHPATVSIIEFRDGLVARETWYFAGPSSSEWASASRPAQSGPDALAVVIENGRNAIG